MRNPCWSKVLREIGVNKTRTLLVVLSIAVGVFAVGTMTASQVILARNMNESFLAISPSSGLISADPFDDELLGSVRHMPEVGAAEGRYRLDLRVQMASGQWRSLQLYALPDYDNIQINKIVSERGAWPPPERAMLIERAALGLLGAREGDMLEIETPGGKRRTLPVAGVAHDVHQWPANFGVIAYGYITFDTLEWLGQPWSYNELYFVAADTPYDKAHAQEVAAAVRERVEKTGRTVHQLTIRDPGKHNAYDLIQSLTMMLGLLGVVALLLSGFLVINTISALLAQQTRQIGVLKAVGARNGQVVRIYLSIVVVFGLLALALAIPLGVLGSRVFTAFLLNLFNFDLVSFSIPPYTLALQVAVGLFVPVLAALYPVLAGTRVTVREAMVGQGLGGARPGWLLTHLLPRALALRVPQPLTLALRNTFRRKGRLALTLLTLTFGGAMFIAVVNVRSGLFQTLDDVMQYWKFDLEVVLQRPYTTEQMRLEALRVPGVVGVETWGGGVAFRVRPDGSEHEALALYAPPPASEMITPILNQGRWLLPDDDNAIVLNTAALQQEPDLKVGDTLTLSIAGKQSRWQVVGIATGQIAGMGGIGYVNNAYFSRLTGQVGSSSRLLLRTERHDKAGLIEARQELERSFQQSHIQVATINANSDMREGMEGIFGIFVMVTLVMAVLLAVVGGLGLAGLMSLNVLERQREIGVLRAVGASNGAVLRIVMTEGVLIGLISWALAVAVAVPLSKAFSYGVGVGFLSMPLAERFAAGGVALWFGVAVVLAAVASFLPAWHAARLTVRDVLAYE